MRQVLVIGFDPANFQQVVKILQTVNRLQFDQGCASAGNGVSD